ncbi:MAG: isoprenyl transferase [Oscillospiraceae bacterium]|nr:isoprenyl transferase [Oscillospiraceae bacterium]
MRLFKQRKQEKLARPVPRHIAIIMDGNGRWAQKRGLPRTAGHAAGCETFRRISNYCKAIGVQYFTVYAFSTENWKRGKDEVDTIMGLMERYLKEALLDMKKNQVRIRFFGDLSRLSPDLRHLAEEAEEESSDYRIQANICLNYGGRDEIVRAARAFARECAEGRADPEDLTEERFSDLLFSAGVPDPDLIIRPSGEIRVSNFLLWQSAYSEYYFTEALWPDFDEAELEKAIASYHGRSRRFGGVKK